MTKSRILIAGATGYLGKFITQELIEKDYEVKIVVRSKEKIKFKAPNLEISEA